MTASRQAGRQAVRRLRWAACAVHNGQSDKGWQCQRVCCAYSLAVDGWHHTSTAATAAAAENRIAAVVVGAVVHAGSSMSRVAPAECTSAQQARACTAPLASTAMPCHAMPSHSTNQPHRIASHRDPRNRRRPAVKSRRSLGAAARERIPLHTPSHRSAGVCVCALCCAAADSSLRIDFWFCCRCPDGAPPPARPTARFHPLLSLLRPARAASRFRRGVPLQQRSRTLRRYALRTAQARTVTLGSAMQGGRALPELGWVRMLRSLARSVDECALWVRVRSDCLLLLWVRFVQAL